MHILNRRPDQRTNQDIETLNPLIKSIEFFKEKEIKENDLNEIANVLKYEYHRNNNLVFDFGKLHKYDQSGLG